MNSIKRKRTELLARGIINKISGIKLIGFEDENSLCLTNSKNVLKQLHSIDSTPVDFIKVGMARNDYIIWIQKCFDFLKDKNEWLILVPNCEEPIWANVLVTNFYDAVSSLWDISECNEFVVLDKNTQQIGAIFCEEKYYEFHKR